MGRTFLPVLQMFEKATCRSDDVFLIIRSISRHPRRPMLFPEISKLVIKQFSSNKSANAWAPVSVIPLSWRFRAITVMLLLSAQQIACSPLSRIP